MSEVKEVAGYKWFVPDEPYRNLPLEDWERRHRDWVIQHVPKKGTFIDIGANSGAYAVTLAHHFESVVAVEPAPENVRVLAQNIRLNGIENIVIVQYAAWDECRMIDFHQCLLNDLASAAVASDDPKPYGLTPVKTTRIQAATIDSFHFTGVSAVKIDVEGGEGHVLLGMLDTIRREKPVMLIEVHEEGMLSFIKGLMETLGYELENPEEFKRLALLRFIRKGGK
jgi:FkbM family methyltransferase